MRLTDHQIETITTTIHQCLGEQAQVKLFGSRIDDQAKGGDIDLFINTNEPVNCPALAIAKIQAKLIMQLGDQKIDIILQAPNLQIHPINVLAESQGVLL